jgi:hypothetical protein
MFFVVSSSVHQERRPTSFDRSEICFRRETNSINGSNLMEDELSVVWSSNIQFVFFAFNSEPGTSRSNIATYLDGLWGTGVTHIHNIINMVA